MKCLEMTDVISKPFQRFLITMLQTSLKVLFASSYEIANLEAAQYFMEECFPSVPLLNLYHSTLLSAVHFLKHFLGVENVRNVILR